MKEEVKDREYRGSVGSDVDFISTISGRGNILIFFRKLARNPKLPMLRLKEIASRVSRRNLGEDRKVIFK